jgi:hypothetical protein
MSSLKNNSEILALTTEKEIGSLPKDNHVQYYLLDILIHRFKCQNSPFSWVQLMVGGGGGINTRIFTYRGYLNM